jgi:tRNA(Ile)-lysidine synthase
MAERALEVARASGLIETGKPLLVLLSGGADSVCLLDCAVRLEADVAALHVNYGLRPGADADEQFCRVLCDRLGVALTVERVELKDEGNLQAQAREARYALAERIAAERGGDYGAAHTASDQAETVLYRLAVSPGSRALLGMAPRRGRLVRPLLDATRDETHEYCRAAGLSWREDPTNADPRFARNRLRHEVLPVLRALSPAAERTIAQTSFLLREERAFLERQAELAIERLAAAGGAIAVEALGAEPAALARVILTRLAERAAGEPVALSRADSAAVLALGEAGGTQSLDLGGGLRAVVEYGTLRFTRGAAAPPPAPPEVELPVPGRVEFGDWAVEARVERVAQAAGGGFLPSRGDALLSPATLATTLTVRSWRQGDRIQPAGLDGSKTLQDLFTDQKVPRDMRARVPVVESDGEIAWVAGLAIGERFRAAPDEERVVVLTAREHEH